MNEIEKKRKELEKGYNEIKDLDKHQNKNVRLYYFNLGVELAQKELLGELNKLINKWKDWYRFDVAQIDENWIREMEELKQSLEVKE
jgi:hypothetical protein